MKYDDEAILNLLERSRRGARLTRHERRIVAAVRDETVASDPDDAAWWYLNYPIRKKGRPKA